MIPEPQRTFLLELLVALGAAADGFVLVGGQALRFMIAKPRPTRYFDFVLDIALLQQTDVSVASILASLGYVPVENARNFHFEKQIPNSLEIMRIELMAPAELVRKDGIRVDVQEGIHGRACVGGSIVVVETSEHEVTGSLPDGKKAKARIQVTQPHALVMLKLLAIDERYRNLRGAAHLDHDRQEARTHADDIVAVVTAQPNLEEFRTRFAEQFVRDDDLKKRTYDIIQTYFGDENKPGVTLYRESLAANLPEGETVRELTGELRRAQRLISSLMTC
jgi:hypothetical protein